MAKRVIIWGLVFAASLYLGAIYFLMKNQRVLQYTPGKAFLSLEEVDLPEAGRVTIPIDEYVRVRGWYIPPSADKPIIVYYKGNEGSFTEEHSRFAAMAADGYGVLAFDYRGFPMSPGEITEENILEDALAAFDWAKARGAPVVLWGRSLGSGPAVYVASQREAVAVVLESPYTASVDVAAERYPIIPVYNLMKDKFLSREWIGDVEEPIFIGHGTADKTIPVHHGRNLYELAPNGEELWISEGGTHESLWDEGIWAHGAAFFDQALMAQGK